MAEFNPAAEAKNLSDMFGAQRFLDERASRSGNVNKLLDQINSEYCGLTPDQRSQTLSAIRVQGQLDVDTDGFEVVSGLAGNDSYASLRCDEKK